MKKSTKIIIAVIVIILIIAVVVAILMKTGNNNPEEGKTENKSTNLAPINSEEDLTALVEQVYEGQEAILPSSISQMTVDLEDSASVKSYTGLETAEDIEYIVVSEPMISSIPYSLIMVKVKDGVNANEIAKAMSGGVDQRKWICVTADKLYATNSGNIAFLVMAKEEIAKPIYEKFKTLAGTVGEEYEKTYEDGELPADTPTLPVPSEQ